jgi:hypothetical protein
MPAGLAPGARLLNVQVLMGLSPSPWRARTRQVGSRSSQKVP